MEHSSARSDGPLCAPHRALISFIDVALPSEREKPCWLDWTIESSPSTRWVCSVGSPRAGRVSERAIMQPFVRDDVGRSLTSYRPVVHTCSHFGARYAAPDRARRRRFLNISTAREPTGLSSRRRLLLLALHRMTLTKESKMPSRFAREIDIFSTFAWLVPTLDPRHNSRFRVSRSTICWSRR